MVADRVKLAFKAALDAHERAAVLHDRAGVLFNRLDQSETAERHRQLAQRQRDRHDTAVAEHPDWL